MEHPHAFTCSFISSAGFAKSTDTIQRPWHWEVNVDKSHESPIMGLVGSDVAVKHSAWVNSICKG